MKLVFLLSLIAVTTDPILASLSYMTETYLTYGIKFLVKKISIDFCVKQLKNLKRKLTPSK